MKTELIAMKDQEKEYNDKKEGQANEAREIASKTGDLHTDLLIALEVTRF